jgi:hypothetical protein
MKAARIAPWVALGAATVLIPLGVLALRDVKANHEPALRGPSSPAWHAHIGAVHDALARADVSAAAQAWHAGYPAVLENRGWESLLEAGDAYLRLGEASGTRQAAEVRARDLYLRALFRAREVVSIEGVLRAAEAFTALGDREVVEQSIRIAEGLGARKGQSAADARIREFRARVSPWLAGPERLAP